MKPSAVLDVTGGVTAREIALHPGALQPIRDPTDPRCAMSLPDDYAYAADPPRIMDPTDARYGSERT